MRPSLFSSAVLTALSIHRVVASPVQALDSRQVVDDATVLNYALTLEHLENAFYSGALARFDEQAFADAGMPAYSRKRFQQIADHEATHVKFLSTALGDKATQPCQYNFPYTDPKSFSALSQVLEGVGVSAYTGAAQLISSKDYLTVAASILSTEARHASWVAAAVNKFAGWSGAFDTPLGLNEVYTLAAAFITGCPSTNPSLPVVAHPKFSLQDPSPGKAVHISFENNDSKGATFIAFYNGLSPNYQPIVDGAVTIPGNLEGTVYAVATTSNNAASGASIVAGPAILLFEYNSNHVLVSSLQAN